MRIWNAFFFWGRGREGKPSKYVPGVKPSEHKINSLRAAEVMLSFAYVAVAFCTHCGPIILLDFHRHARSAESHCLYSLLPLNSPIFLSILSGYRCYNRPVAPADID